LSQFFLPASLFKFVFFSFFLHLPFTISVFFFSFFLYLAFITECLPLFLSFLSLVVSVSFLFISLTGFHRLSVSLSFFLRLDFVISVFFSLVSPSNFYFTSVSSSPLFTIWLSLSLCLLPFYFFMSDFRYLGVFFFDICVRWWGWSGVAEVFGRQSWSLRTHITTTHPRHAACQLHARLPITI
jgi:hypothetical protein